MGRFAYAPGRPMYIRDDYVVSGQHLCTRLDDGALSLTPRMLEYVTPLASWFHKPAALLPMCIDFEETRFKLRTLKLYVALPISVIDDVIQTMLDTPSLHGYGARTIHMYKCVDGVISINTQAEGEWSCPGYYRGPEGRIVYQGVEYLSKRETEMKQMLVLIHKACPEIPHKIAEW